MMRILFAPAAAALLCLSSFAAGAHVDIVPYYEVDAAGRLSLRVGSFDLAGETRGTQAIQRNVLAFSGMAAIGPGGVANGSGVRNNGDPGFSRPMDALDPSDGDGFGAIYPDGTLPAGYGALWLHPFTNPSLGRALSYWDGVGAPSFGPAPGGEMVDVYKINPLGPPVSFLNYSSESAAAGAVQVSSGLFPNFHEHTLASVWGSPTRTAGDYPTPGFYLYSAQIEVRNDFVVTRDGEFLYPGTNLSPVFHLLVAVEFEKYETYIAGYEDVEKYDDEGNLIVDEFGNPVLTSAPIYAQRLSDKMNAALRWVETNLAPVPEPSSLVLGLSLLVGIGCHSRKLCD